jgi:hypothetical protein
MRPARDKEAVMTRSIFTLSLLALVVVTAGAAGESTWFDMDSCVMCKSMASNPKLMENLNWEQHNISNGFVAVTTVSEKYLDDYRAAHEDMNKTAMRLHKGEMLELCESCTALGKCMMKGVSQEYVETSSGDVWIVTSDNPEVVAELQNWVKRNKMEMAKHHEGHHH